MNIKLFDNHTHSNNSHDGVDSVDDMCKSAIERGMYGFSVTDHFECDHEEIEVVYGRLENSIKYVNEAKEKYAGKLLVTLGIELAQGHIYQDISNRALSMADYDIVIGSIHTVMGGQDAYWVDFSNPDIDIDKLLEQYFTDLYNMTLWDKFDTMAHLTYPERYISGNYGKPVEYHRYSDLLDSIFKSLIEHGKSLEINTQGLRGVLGKSAPDLDMVARYRELGGELITLGSDAHNRNDLAKHIPEVTAKLQNMGFKYLTHYVNRKPQMIKITP